MYLLHTFIIIYMFCCQTFDVDHCEVDITKVCCILLCTSRRIIDGCAHDWGDTEQGVQDQNKHVDLCIWYDHDLPYSHKPFLLWKVSMNMLGILTIIQYSSCTASIFVDPESFGQCGAAQWCQPRHVGGLPKGWPWWFWVWMKKTWWLTMWWLMKWWSNMTLFFSFVCIATSLELLMVPCASTLICPLTCWNLNHEKHTECASLASIHFIHLVPIHHQTEVLFQTGSNHYFVKQTSAWEFIQIVHWFQWPVSFTQT